VRASWVDRAAPEINHHPLGFLVDINHFGNLCFAFLVVFLVDADGIDPESPQAICGLKELEHVPAVLRLEKDVPMRTDENWPAAGVVVILSTPGI
jgi:hypothetical protein